MLAQIKEKLEHPERLEAQNLRHVDRKKLRETSRIVNSVINRVKNKNITKTNVLLLAGANVVADLMNIKKKKASRDKDPWWKKRITGKIRELQKDISKLDQWHRKSLKGEHTKNRLEQVYHVKRKGILVVIEELKQRVKAKAAKTKKYEERNNQFLQNRLFQTNRKRLFEKIDGKERNCNSILNNLVDCREYVMFIGGEFCGDFTH